MALTWIIEEYELDFILYVPGVPNRSLPLQRNNFKVYRGRTNRIPAKITNQDRQRVNLLGRQIRFVMYDPDLDSVVLEKRLKALDPRRGTVNIEITPNDVSSLPSKFYEYALFYIDQEGIEQPLYAGQNQKGTDFVELLDGVQPSASPPVEIDTRYERLTPTPNREARQLMPGKSPGDIFFITSAYRGDSQTARPDYIGTFAMYPENFTGIIKLQGSLYNAIEPGDDFWFDICINGKNELRFVNCSSVTAFNFKGNFMWLRFIIQPDQSIRLPDGTFSGSVRKILLKA